MLSEYNDKSVVLRWDGRCDSPGKSAKYCTYSLMDSENDKILYVETVDKREVGLKSNFSMQYLTNKKGIKISETVTDAHIYCRYILNLILACTSFILL